jgi:hypothetical protein
MDLSKNGGLLDSFYDDIIAYKEKIIELFKEQLTKCTSDEFKKAFSINTNNGMSTI